MGMAWNFIGIARRKNGRARPTADVAMFTRALDLDSLLAEKPD
jgi:hypothetical protein